MKLLSRIVENAGICLKIRALRCFQFPNVPASSEEHFRGESRKNGHSGKDKSVQKGSSSNATNTNQVPAKLTERTLEKKVVSGLPDAQIAQRAVNKAIPLLQLFLSMRSLVLRLSRDRSQSKPLILGMQLDFQIQQITFRHQWKSK